MEASRTLHRLLPALSAVLLMVPATATAQLDDPLDVVSVTPALSKSGFTPGATFQAALVLDIKQGYHLNGHETSDPTLVPTSLEVPKESPVSWPYIRYPEDQVRSGMTVFGLHEETYEERVIVRLVGRLPVDAEVGKTIETTLSVRYQTCTDAVCLFPVSKPVTVSIPVVAPGTAVKDLHPEIFGPPKGAGR